MYFYYFCFMYKYTFRAIKRRFERYTFKARLTHVFRFLQDRARRLEFAKSGFLRQYSKLRRSHLELIDWNNDCDVTILLTRDRLDISLTDYSSITRSTLKSRTCLHLYLLVTSLQIGRIEMDRIVYNIRVSRSKMRF